MLKDSPKAVPMTKKGNVPCGKADLAATVLASVRTTWQNQYNLTYTTVPKSTCALLPDLETFEQVMVEKQQDKLKAKGKAATTRPEAKSNPKQQASRGLTDRVPKKSCSEKFCQLCKAHGGSYQTHNTLDCRCYDGTVSPSRQQKVSPLSPRSLTRSSGAIKAWPLCRPCSRPM
jgi:hypothetical protein